MPLFDSDTNMLFLAGKGDTTIMYMEVTDRDPYLVEGIRHSGEQTKGVCLVPKRALNVMHTTYLQYGDSYHVSSSTKSMLY